MARLITRAQAKAEGLPRYYTGKPCLRGHIAERMVCNAGCVTCIEAKLKKWNKPDKGRRSIRLRQREYRASPDYKPAPNNKVARNSRSKAQYTKHSHKVRARTAVRDALRSGLLKKQPCVNCGSVKVQAHHRDYNKPLEVEWLCSKCHGTQHRID